MQAKFAYEDLDVWKESVTFSRQVIQLSEKLDTNRPHYRVIEQLESASTSVALNIAEGKGRFSKKEFIRHLYIARGSLFETMTLLSIFTQLGWVETSEIEDLRELGDKIGRMLSKLISSINTSMKKDPVRSKNELSPSYAMSDER